jgi:hypothetical protein
VGAVLAALWPSAAILLGALAIVLALCVRAPAYGFALALVLYSFEGTVKMRLSVEGAPSPVALGAAALDLAFLVSLAALLLQDRGRSLRELWGRATRLERWAAGMVGAWLVLSVLQIPVSGDLTKGLEGFRLTQLYVPAALGGVVLAARLGEERLVPLLLGVLALGVLYAALRGLTGPTENEQLFAERRASNANFGDLGRNTGSFTGPVGLVSFLVPASVICLVLGFLRADRRWLFSLGFALAMTGLIASYVRTALVAVVAGVAVMALLMLLQKGASRRHAAYAVAAVVVVLGGGYAATLLAGDASPVAKHRAEALANPFTDASLTTRFHTWGRTIDKVTPVGTGLGTVGRATAKGRKATFTDSSYLKILQEQGPLGALLFLGGVGGLFVAAAIGLVRAGPVRRPLGTAALAGFGGFLVLMVMGEYIEQPGKLLAWTLLGVALWEASRPDTAEPVEYRWPSRRSLAAVLEPAVGVLRALPRMALWLGIAVGLAIVAFPLAVRALSDSEYVSRTESLLAPPGPSAAWQLQIGRLLGDPSFQQGIALDSARNVDVRRVSATFGDRDGNLTFAISATGSTPRQAKRLAQATASGLLGATYFVSNGKLHIERTRLRERLADNASPGERAVSRRRLREIDGALQLRALYLAHPVVASEPPPGPLVDRIVNDVAGRLAPPPTAAWAGLAGLVCALLLGVAALVSATRYTATGR